MSRSHGRAVGVLAANDSRTDLKQCKGGKRAGGKHVEAKGHVLDVLRKEAHRRGLPECPQQETREQRGRADSQEHFIAGLNNDIADNQSQ